MTAAVEDGDRSLSGIGAAHVDDSAFRGYAGFGTNDLLGAAEATDRNGLTAVGRALQKHSDRQGSVFFGLSSGTAAARNEQGLEMFQAILTGPGQRLWVGSKVFEIWDAGGRGLRFGMSGRFIGFLEPVP